MERSRRAWAKEEFGGAQLGDERRTNRLVDMAECAEAQPAGKVSSVFTLTKDREGAYDFLENPRFSAADVGASAYRATARRARGKKVVYVPIDISHLTLTDEDESKFGPVGAPNKSVRGVMVVSALGITKEGVPLGLLDQQYWERGEIEKLSKSQRNARNRQRPFEDKQGSRFTSAAAHAIERLGDDVRPWVIIDREGDNRDILLRLSKMECDFTVRATWDRKLDGEPKQTLREMLEKQPPLAVSEVVLARNGKRIGRSVEVEIRAAKAAIRFEQPHRVVHELYAVLVREKGRSGKAHASLDWLLYTNRPIVDAPSALGVMAAYRARWRIEEFHRTWKKGVCRVEDSQLRSGQALAKWATILAVVATRIERLKYLRRYQPDEPISGELEPVEIEALRIAYKRHLKKPDLILPDMPTNQEAVHWIATMGGWMGEKTSGPPGAMTLGRGLDILAIFTSALLAVRDEKTTPSKRARRK